MLSSQEGKAVDQSIRLTVLLFTYHLTLCLYQFVGLYSMCNIELRCKDTAFLAFIIILYQRKFPAFLNLCKNV